MYFLLNILIFWSQLLLCYTLFHSRHSWSSFNLWRFLQPQSLHVCSLLGTALLWLPWPAKITSSQKFLSWFLLSSSPHSHGQLSEFTYFNSSLTSYIEFFEGRILSSTFEHVDVLYTQSLVQGRLSKCFFLMNKWKNEFLNTTSLGFNMIVRELLHLYPSDKVRS